MASSVSDEGLHARASLRLGGVCKRAGRTGVEVVEPLWASILFWDILPVVSSEYDCGLLGELW
jgi:hypothetical protein